MTGGKINHTTPSAAGHLLFFDLARNVVMISVILYHAVAAYSTMAPWWPVHDGASLFTDFVRQVFDVFMMPAFFFIAGYFALYSFQKKGLGFFLAGKFRRLGIPWLLVILTIIPIFGYKGQLKYSAGIADMGFWHYWINKYIGGFGTFHLGIVPPGHTSQMHFWFISLLLFFFIVFGFLYQVINKMRGTFPSSVLAKPASNRSVLRALLLFGLLTSTVYFVTILLFPDISWVTLHLLLQFQATKVCLYALYFGLGIYAYSRQWFMKEAFPGRLAVWTLGCILLTAGYLVVGQDVFAHPDDSQTLSPVILLTFAFVRSFLCLAFLFMLTSFALRYMNRPLALNQEMAAHSFNIYMVHLFFVIVLQDILMTWGGGPILAKIGIVFLITVPVSYGISCLINRFPRGFTVGLLGLFVLMLAK